jgi:hypothetical protein
MGLRVLAALAGRRHRDIFGVTGGSAGLGKHHGVFGGKYLLLTGYQPLHVILDILIGDDRYLFLKVFNRPNVRESIAPAVFGISIFAYQVQDFIRLSLSRIFCRLFKSHSRAFRHKIDDKPRKGHGKSSFPNLSFFRNFYQPKVLVLT